VSAANPSYVWFIARLRKARLSRKLTQGELAAKLGKPQSYVSKYEVGERRLDFIEAVRIAHVLTIKVSALIPPELK
jgi:transcriptional regulator with XRE-family HTH domain